MRRYVQVSAIAKREAQASKTWIKKFKRKERKRKSLVKQLEERKRRDLYRTKSDGFLRSMEWRQLRYATLRRYGHSCMSCGSKPPNVVLHVDHIKPRFFYPELALDPENLQVLCENCNLGKGARFEDDLRPK